jgi:hypothetical protein
MDLVYTHDFLILDNVLADAQHLLDHLPLLHHDLFLGHGDQDLVVANFDLLGCLAFLNGDALHTRFFALSGNLNRVLVALARMVAPLPLAPPRAVSPKSPFLRAFTVLVVLGESAVAAVSTSHAVPPHLR